MERDQEENATYDRKWNERYNEIVARTTRVIESNPEWTDVLAPDSTFAVRLGESMEEAKFIQAVATEFDIHMSSEFALLAGLLLQATHRLESIEEYGRVLNEEPVEA